MIADDHQGTMKSGFLTSLAFHGHRRTPVFAEATPGMLFRRSFICTLVGFLGAFTVGCMVLRFS